MKQERALKLIIFNIVFIAVPFILNSNLYASQRNVKNNKYQCKWDGNKYHVPHLIMFNSLFILQISGLSIDLVFSIFFLY